MKMENRKKMLMSEDEHDITKKMLYTIRAGNLMTEAETAQQTMPTQPQAQPQAQSQAPSESSQSEDLNEDQFAEEQKKFMEVVSPKVQFNSFKIYRKERNVVFNGQFQDMNGLEWVMSLREADGLSITVDNLILNGDSISVLNKLHGYYVNWSKEWSTLLNTEYKYKG